MSDDFENEEIKDAPTLGVYEGERNNMQERHGKGKNTFPNGDVYEGQYANGVRNGVGIYRWKSGARYAGRYSNGVRDGDGLFVYNDGSKYKGPFEAGKRSGKDGLYLYSNGDVYQGEWKNDLKDGKGVFIYKSGGKKSGVWSAGVLTGYGEIVHSDHKIFGNWATNGSMSLPAKIQFSNGYTQEINDAKYFAIPVDAS